MKKNKKESKNSFKNYIHIFALPWCCVLPIAVAALGLAGGTIGTFLSAFTPHFLILSIALIGYSNYNVWFGHRSPRSKVWVTAITIFAILSWIWSIVFVMKWISI